MSPLRYQYLSQFFEKIEKNSIFLVKNLLIPSILLSECLLMMNDLIHDERKLHRASSSSIQYMKKMSARDLILKFLESSLEVHTLEVLLVEINKYELPYFFDIEKLKRIIQKMANQELIEFVYIDHSYGVRIKSPLDTDNTAIVA